MANIQPLKIRLHLFRAAVVEHNERPLLDQCPDDEAGHDVSMIAGVVVAVVPGSAREGARRGPLRDPRLVQEATEGHIPDATTAQAHADLGAAPRIDRGEPAPLLIDSDGYTTGHVDSIRGRRLTQKPNAITPDLRPMCRKWLNIKVGVVPERGIEPPTY